MGPNEVVVGVRICDGKVEASIELITARLRDRAGIHAERPRVIFSRGLAYPSITAYVIANVHIMVELPGLQPR